LNDLVQYYTGLIILLIIYGITINYLSLPNIGIYVVWFSFTLILIAIKEGNPINFLGLNLNKKTIFLFLIGSIIAVIIQITILLVMILINVSNIIYAFSPDMSFSMFKGLIITGFIAVSEEIVFRGYPIRKMKECANEFSILLITGLIFSLFHISNLGYNFNAFIFLIIANILLGKLIIDSKYLWASIAFHFTWNFVEGYVLGLPISGFISRSTIFKIELRGNKLITGGVFGIEASLVSIIIFVLALVIYSLVKKIKL